jgi:hypothetical protein
MVKYAGPQITGVQGRVIDLVSDTFARTQAPNYLTNVPGIPTTPRLFDAFSYVRKKVSDHLPVVCTLNVPGRT